MVYSKRVDTASGYIQGPVDPRPTRYDRLGYRPCGRGLWRIVDLDGGPDAQGFYMNTIGPMYRTQAELLADLDRYATDNGY